MAGNRERLKEAGEQFQRDVAEHELRVLHDNGLYRHLRLKQPGTTNRYFDLVTWPGYLAYAGDMGEFVFTRVEDMFTFFRGHKPSPGYWAEKARAIDKNGGLEEFSEDTFKASLQERLDDFLESYYPAPHDPDDETEAQRETREESVQELRDEIDVALLRLGDDRDGRAAIGAVMEVEDTAGRRPFREIYEHRLTEWTFRFLWCCYAIPWAIAKYDAAKASQAVAP